MKWSSEQVAKLKELYPKHKNPQIAEMMGVSYSSVVSKASELGLRKPWTKPKFSPDPFDLICIEHMHYKFLMPINTKIFGVSESTFRKLCDRHGFKKDPELKKLRQRKKGQSPPNKGKKMSPEVREKVKHTWFKKGHKPVSTKKDGDITVRKDSNGNRYKWIRLQENLWEMLHVHIWKKHHGSVTPGHIIVFKDHDQMNCDVSNLEEISLAENMKRNSGMLNLPDSYIAHLLAGKDKALKKELMKHPEILEVKRAQVKLNRTIKNGEQREIS